MDPEDRVITVFHFTGVRNSGNMYVTNCHDMTLAVKIQPNNLLERSSDLSNSVKFKRQTAGVNTV